ncbi:(d)CMP kinase [Thermodesulfovibrionales bacterium]|nr:(d)CMP kinase [Thermodesulfovibrionales bacterium]MCL0066680.1 (d)CMP kinase [Thermodesulfovibrionales bacterium]MCL0074532.1 (d)CMP kinase [Thermodesulfovibrionales bacterium]
MKKVIAIDGPSGVGKSAVARLVAERLGFQFLDTGALYRAIALYLIKRDIMPDNTDSRIFNALSGITVGFRDGKVFLNSENVSKEIRTTKIETVTSIFSAKGAVRDFIFDTQRHMSRDSNLVAEGRDMTTVVFPDAWKKFYLDASLKERAKRRHLQLKGTGTVITIDEALRNIKERDSRDMNRDIAPLKRTDDAVYIDTTDLDQDEVVGRILKETRC